MRKQIMGGAPIEVWGFCIVAAVLTGACSGANVMEGRPDDGLSPGSGGSKSGVAGSSSFDDSPVVNAATRPPPASGGTLLALRAGGGAVAADTERDRVLVVDLGARRVTAEIPLGRGAEPGRLVEDADGRVHVALRGTGELVTLDVAAGTLIARRAACAAPRGVAYDAANDAVLVACLEGTLVELPAAGGAPTRVTAVATDLRDVVFLGQELAVTRFRSAEVLLLDDQRRVAQTTTLGADAAGFAPAVAWRAVAAPNGQLAIAHQRAFAGRLLVDASGGSGGTGGTSEEPGRAGSAGSSVSNDAGAGDGPELSLSGGYGSGERCASVVTSTFSYVSASGAVQSGPHLDRGVLPLDIATKSGALALVFAGNQSGNGNVAYYRPDESSVSNPDACLPIPTPWSVPGAVAVAFEPVNGTLLVQSREPAGLTLIDLPTSSTEGTVPSGTWPTVDFGGPSGADTGYDLFNSDAGGGIACASCHPEGTEDGRVWHFSDVGARRTQPLDVGLAGTAPFHWDGELATFDALMSRIFTERMGGPLESAERGQALEDYVDALSRRPALRPADDPAAVRGKTLFESAATGCTGCHSGANFSSGASAAVGKGRALQIPSLVAVGARAPYMHDGCAATLLERFDPQCGGTSHGDISSLTIADLGDLVAYLESL